MTTYVVEPRDPLFIRDGRPMNTGGSAARSLSFPLPSTLAGLARTRAALDAGGSFRHPKPRQLLEEVAIAGPLLCRLQETGESAELFVPAPRDVVWFSAPQSEGRASVRGYRLRPSSNQAFGEGATTDLDTRLRLLAFERDPGKSKATSGPPFLSMSQLSSWLARPEALLENGTSVELIKERRTHVAIDAATRTAADAMLFSTEGWRFATRENRLGLVFRYLDTQRRTLPPGIVHLGGERRVSFLRAQQNEPWPAIPDEVRRLEASQLARVILLTPGIFSEGAVPRSLLGAEVVAAAVSRPEVVSGWDFERPGPKPTRRMAPAGSVYWVRVPDASWAKETWFESVCPDPQDRRDGFGLAAIGVE